MDYSKKGKDMKKHFLFTVLTSLVLSLVSCSSSSEEEPVVPEITVPENSYDFFTNNADFQSKSSEKTVIFTSNVDWTVSIPENIDWLNVSQTSGKAGIVNLNVKVTENTSNEDRSTVLCIIAGTVTKIIKVNQKGKDALLVSANKFEVGEEGGFVSVSVKSNVYYTEEIDAACSSWIHKNSGSRAMSSQTLIFTVDANEEYEKREGKITFKSGTMSETITITQAAKERFLTLETKTLTLAIGESSTLTVKNETGSDYLKYTSSNASVASVDNNGKVTALKKGEATITVSSADGKYSDQCVVTVKEFLDYITVYCSGASVISINGLIKYGSSLYWTLLNKSTKPVTLVSVQLVDGVTNTKTNELAVNKTAEAGESASCGVSVPLLGIHAPVTCIFKFTCDGTTYTKEAVYKND